MKKIILSIFAILLSVIAFAQSTDITEFNYAGPFVVKTPLMLDSLDVNAKPFEPRTLLDSFMDLSVVNNGKRLQINDLPQNSEQNAIHLIGFNISNPDFTKADITVRGMKHFNLYVDGNKVDGKNIKLQPAVHEVVVKYLTNTEEQMPMWGVGVTTDNNSPIQILNAGEQRYYQLTDVLNCWRFNRIDLSPDGKFMIVGYSMMQKDGKTITKTLVKNIATGAVIDQRQAAFWMPVTNNYCYVRNLDGKRSLIAVDPENRQERLLADNLPEGNLKIAPSEDYIIISRMQKGNEEDKEVYQVITPDDRQPGYRNRMALDIMDLKTDIVAPLTFGHHNCTLEDISADGKTALIAVNVERLQHRPTTRTTLMAIHMDSYKADTLVFEDGFIDYAQFSPDANRILIIGSPEALDGVGNILPQGVTPSMIDKQLFIMDINTRMVKPMTRDFNPSITAAMWNKNDNMIYFKAEDKDCIHLFKLNPDNGKISILNIPEELVENFSCAAKANQMAIYAQSASNSDRLYLLNTKNGSVKLLEDLSAETLKNIKLGECAPWTFVNSKGDSICCRFYLPPDFQPAKRYPMIVNYYGGCSPTSRNFESRYPHHAYAAQGYVVLVVNPSGATGFGQEFSSRHVNTAGDGVAEDIIGATQQFCTEHQFVDKQHIGCIGASYGGFMSQYLQTKTNIFAAAISHAGISDHTSYWGEGYWGYSYSEVSMANSYPWTDKQLFVEQSPLFNADKINTPILFLHGDKDTNVPVGESIQMFTALKLLGKETAMVLVKDQDHHILDYNKRIKWQNTIFAWFAKYLKNDPSWWNAIYKQPQF